MSITVRKCGGKPPKNGSGSLGSAAAASTGERPDEFRLKKGRDGTIWGNPKCELSHHPASGKPENRGGTPLNANRQGPKPVNLTAGQRRKTQDSVKFSARHLIRVRAGRNWDWHRPNIWGTVGSRDCFPAVWQLTPINSARRKHCCKTQLCTGNFFSNERKSFGTNGSNLKKSDTTSDLIPP